MIRYLTAFSMALACLVGVMSEGFAATVASANPWKQPHLIVNNDLTNWSLLIGATADSRAGASPAAVHDAFVRSLALGQFPGADAQSLSVQYSMFPWWKGKLYTLADHVAFLEKLPYFAGENPSPSFSPGLNYLKNGGDFVGDFLKSSSPQMKILDFRLNDYHYNWNYALWKSKSKADVLGEAHSNHGPYCDGGSLNNALTAQEFTESAFTAYFDALGTGKLDPSLDGRCVGKTCISAAEFAQQCAGGKCLIQSHSGRCPTVTTDFGKAVVRKLKLMQIVDLATSYKTADAIEIDFDRNPQDFDPAVGSDERVRIMTEWLASVRAALKSAAPGLKLGIRVPGRDVHRRVVGVDLEAIGQKALADYAILASPVLADQQADFPGVGAGHIPFYLEMTNLISSGDLARANIADPAHRYHFRYPSTTLALTTAAHVAYRHGAVGMALFNSQYYASLGGSEGGVPMPTAAFSCMADRACAAQRDQHYFLATNHYGLPKTQDQLPFSLNHGASTHSFVMTMAPPAGGWAQAGGVVRIGFVVRKGRPGGNAAPDRQDLGRAIGVTVNGAALGGAPQWPARLNGDAASDAYDAKLWTNDAQFSKTFAIDGKMLKDGSNSFQVTLDTGAAASVDIASFEIFLPRQAAHP